MPSTMICDCGCGNTYPISQMVHRNPANENLYIPHAIDVYQIFCDPVELRKKLDSSEIHTHYYALPGEPLTAWIGVMQGTYQFMRYVKYFDSKWGAYFVWEINQQALKGEVGTFPVINWVKTF